jgi:hypothetical protein
MEVELVFGQKMPIQEQKINQLKFLHAELRFNIQGGRLLFSTQNSTNAVYMNNEVTKLAE